MFYYYFLSVFIGSYEKVDGPGLYMIEPSGISYVSSYPSSVYKETIKCAIKQTTLNLNIY